MKRSVVSKHHLFMENPHVQKKARYSGQLSCIGASQLFRDVDRYLEIGTLIYRQVPFHRNSRTFINSSGFMNKWRFSGTWGSFGKGELFMYEGVVPKCPSCFGRGGGVSG
jgi:hypothetical protein